MDKSQTFAEILDRARVILAAAPANAQAGRDGMLQQLCQLLADRVDYYNWVGFYIVEPGGTTLRLGPYVGEPTDHVVIPFGRGICGQAAATGKTFLIQDVSSETNYLSCSICVRSEIVLPIYKDAKVVAELDIDSHTLAPFTTEDEAALGELCRMTATLF